MAGCGRELKVGGWSPLLSAPSTWTLAQHPALSPPASGPQIPYLPTPNRYPGISPHLWDVTQSSVLPCTAHLESHFLPLAPTPALHPHRSPGMKLTQHCPADILPWPEVPTGGKLSGLLGLKSPPPSQHPLSLSCSVCSRNVGLFHPLYLWPHCSLCRGHQSHCLRAVSSKRPFLDLLPDLTVWPALDISGC